MFRAMRMFDSYTGRRCIISLLLAVWVITAAANYKNLIFDNLSILDGLPENIIVDIERDSIGYLWIATENGLSRYDGTSFNNYYYSFENQNSISSNVIFDIFIDSGGIVWVATSNGLCKYNPVLDNFIRYIPGPAFSEGTPQNAVRSIAETSGAEIYFILETGQLMSIESDTLKLKLNLQQEACKFMMIDRNDQCWITTRNSIFRYNIRNNLTSQYTIKFPEHLKDPEINDMIILDTIMYITGYRTDLLKYNYLSDELTYCSVLPEDAEPNTTCLMLDGESLFIGSSSHGFSVLNLETSQITTYKEDNRNVKSLSSNAIMDIFKDSQGNLWIGSADAGLDVAYFNRGFTGYSFSYNNFTKNVTVQAIQKDRQNRLWLGYGSSGFEIFDQDYRPVKSVSKIQGLLPSELIGAIFCFFLDRENNMWIGTYSNGVIKYHVDSEMITQYFPTLKGDNYIEGADIRCIKEDPHGNLWIAIHNVGISVKPKNSSSFIPLTEFDRDIPAILNDRWIFDIAFDDLGNLWLAGSRGAYYYDYGSREYRHFTREGSGMYQLADNTIVSICIDSGNNVWLAGYRGINVIRSNAENISITEEDGLPINKVQAMLEDRNQHVWVSSKYGISEIDLLPDNSYTITNFTTDHGLNTNDFGVNSAYSDGEHFYFGGKTGYTVFNPLEVVKDNLPPHLEFTDLYVFDQKVEIREKGPDRKDNSFYLDKRLSYCDRLKISARYNSIGIGFTSLNFTNFSNHYQYKLEGFNDKWVSLDDRNIVYFTNLRRGDYILKIRSGNVAGKWEDSTADLAITIVPPFWKSWFAVTLYILVILIVLLYLFKLSFEKEKIQLLFRQENEIRELRTRFFMNISHELKTPLTLVSVPLKKIINEYQEQHKHPDFKDISMIYRNVDRLMRLINQLFDFRRIELNKVEMKVEKANIVAFTEAIIDYFDYQLQQKGITLTTRFPDRRIEFYFDPDKMDKIIFNLLSNAIKHTPVNGQITFSIHRSVMDTSEKKEQPCVVWSISDTGKGIPEERLYQIFDRFSQGAANLDSDKGGTGIGLSIVKEYTELHHGSIQIESHFDKEADKDTFTRVTLNFPMDEALYSENEKTSDDRSGKLIHDYKIVNQHHPLSAPDLTEELQQGPDCDQTAYTVLVIDDEPDVCLLLANELSDAYQVIQADNGRSGLIKALKYLPDIIISDIMMPEMDGYELCRAIKSRVETSHIPVLLLTAKSSNDDIIEAYHTGADEYISKPFDMPLLRSRVETLIVNRLRLKNSFLSLYGIKLEKVVPTRTDEKFMRKLIQLINENMGERDLNVDMITREMGISRSHLYMKIKTIANTSVNLFIRSIRMQRAAQLLASGGMNISEVAYEVGFNNLPYFSKCFHEEFGESPSKYASTHQTRQ